MSLPKFSRRGFLKSSAILAAGGLAAGGIYWKEREEIRVGLIGAGSRGELLARDIRNCCYFPLYGNVVVVCDVDRNHAQSVASRYTSGAEIYEDYRRVLERDDIQAVFIATPDHWHAPIALAAIHAGKAVYCEKPMTL